MYLTYIYFRKCYYLFYSKIVKLCEKPDTQVVGLTSDGGDGGYAVKQIDTPDVNHYASTNVKTVQKIRVLAPSCAPYTFLKVIKNVWYFLYSLRPSI